MRVDEQRLVAALDAGEAHDRRLPEAAHGGHVQTAAALPMLSARSIAAAILKSSTASATRPRRAATAAWMPGLSELPWQVMGS